MQQPETIHRWVFEDAGKPLALHSLPVPDLDAGNVLLRVSGCGICHTDLGFYYDGVPTKKGLPITLGHEISGKVVAAGSGQEALVGQAVIVPAVIPCGECEWCNKGRGSICPTQVFPGSDMDGGFASHVVIPGKDLCRITSASEVHEGRIGDSGVTLVELSVLADAITTPYQAIHRSGLGSGDLAIFIGVGGVGGFGIQIAAARGATVVAIDVSDDRLNLLSKHGAHWTLNPTEKKGREIKKAIRGFAKENSLPSTGWKIFETSGSALGQELAFDLLVHGAYLSVVGFTMDKVNVRISNLMAFDATAEGNWGCLPEHYPLALDLVLTGKVKIAPFVETFPMSQINDVFAKLHEHKIGKRPVLVPDFEPGE